MKYRLISSPEIEKLDKSKILVLIPMGSIESHGKHLPLGTDSIIVEHFAKKVEEKFSDKLMLTPTINYSFNLINRSYPGTLSVDSEIFAHYLEAVIISFFKSGFSNFFIFSSHGANEIPIKLAINNILGNYCYSTDKVFPKIAYKTWWNLAKLKSRHAEKLETELMMIIKPDFVDMDSVKDCKPDVLWYYFPSRKEYYPNSYGVNGYPSKSNLESAEIVYDKILNSLIEYIDSIKL